MSSLNTIYPVKNAFQPQGGAVLCGIVQGFPQFADRMQQAISALTDKDLLQGLPVAISNAVETAPSPSGLLSSYNPASLMITALATTAATIDGFCVWGENIYADLDGSVGYPRKGMLTNVALIGSGLKVFLPADASLAGVKLNSPVYWNTTTKTLSLSTNIATNVPLNIKIVGSLVDGKKLEKNATTGVIEWVATKAILIQL